MLGGVGQLDARFLSRLCGGESGNSNGFVCGLFLSRLCGGEYKEKTHCFVFAFLSRLCGGEFIGDI